MLLLRAIPRFALLLRFLQRLGLFDTDDCALRSVETAVHGLAIPRDCLVEIPFHALAVFVADAEFVERLVAVLVGGLAEPSIVPVPYKRASVTVNVST